MLLHCLFGHLSSSCFVVVDCVRACCLFTAKSRAFHKYQTNSICCCFCENHIFIIYTNRSGLSHPFTFTPIFKLSVTHSISSIVFVAFHMNQFRILFCPNGIDIDTTARFSTLNRIYTRTCAWVGVCVTQSIQYLIEFCQCSLCLTQPASFCPEKRN